MYEWQRRSVGLQLYHLDIDVVPAIDGGNDKIRIVPTAKKTNGFYLPRNATQRFLAKLTTCAAVGSNR